MNPTNPEILRQLDGWERHHVIATDLLASTSFRADLMSDMAPEGIASVQAVALGSIAYSLVALVDQVASMRRELEYLRELMERR